MAQFSILTPLGKLQNQNKQHCAHLLQTTKEFANDAKQMRLSMVLGYTKQQPILANPPQVTHRDALCGAGSASAASPALRRRWPPPCTARTPTRRGDSLSGVFIRARRRGCQQRNRKCQTQRGQNSHLPNGKNVQI